MIYKTDIEGLKNEINQKIGQKIIVKGSEGRSKPFEKEAIIEGVHPSFFRIKFDESKGEAVTYTYKDILIRSIEVDVYDGNGYSSLIPGPEEKVLK